MPPADLQPDRADRDRRRTARLVKVRTSLRPATVSFGLATVAALLMLVGWRVWRSEEVITPKPRTLTGLELEWKCEVGHRFRAAGHSFGIDGLTSPRACLTCGRGAYPVTRTRYACPDHGFIEVAVRFTVGEDGVVRPSELRLAGGLWVSAEEGLDCPQCGRKLVRKRRDPLADRLSRKTSR